MFVRTKIFHPKAVSKMQIAFRHLENCSPAQKWVNVLIYDVRTSSVIRYLRGFQLCTTFCIVCFGSFGYLYHSYKVKFWVRIRVLRRRTRISNVFYPPVSVWNAGKHWWEGFQRWKSFWRRVHGRRRRIESKTSWIQFFSASYQSEFSSRLENSDWYVLCYLLYCNSFTDLRNKLLFGPDVVFVIVSFFSFWKPWVRSYYRAADK